jgi:AcrR family transcriptional regulator
MDASSRVPARRTYHHGDLRRTLLDAGVALARDGGPDAVVLREATRRAGVVPNAAYRHFASRNDLLQAVRAEALASLAIVMEKELARNRHGQTAADAARAALRAIGTAYLKFAQSQPGLFRTAFAVQGEPETANNPAMAGRSGLNPFQLLSSALDRLAQAGVLPPERRPGAEYLAWSAVHGLAMLALEGPLRRLTRVQTREIGQRLLDMVEKGL